MSTDQRIFISYRRLDCQSQANGLNDGLRNRLPAARVFMDIDSIPPGVDFEEHIRGEIDGCDVVLVLIGDNWLDPREGSDVRRIDEPNDFVRLEVMSALRSRQVRVIPVLVEGAKMPEAAELPKDIARLARLNAFELSESRWPTDLDRLSGYLKDAHPVAKPAPAAAFVSTGGQAPPVPTATAPIPPRPQVAVGQRREEAEPGPLVGRLMVALPVISFGLLSFVPPLVIGSRLKNDPVRRRRMLRWAGVLGAACFLGFVLMGASPVDENGTPTGAASDFATFLIFACMVVGVIVTVRNRKPQPALAGTYDELRRRDLRRQYRELVDRDVSLAASMRVGRPDLARDFDDGGLVDVNSMPSDGLQRFAGMSQAEAADVVRVRSELGRFSSLAEMEAFATLTAPTVARLREVAVFV